ncbi:TSUP family transporter [Duganella sp. FT80W]|uniref:Probable membrane transporter protein n=1 Tax=Duganella guangzhouensis TaxID=2666084 RepID=A0A6I2KZ74_9BURK|nr:TSUP family transporter [Duganella guangzhouensis]MRW89319.1 TSUP family transporter [Duganella guangzhouensis]
MPLDTHIVLMIAAAGFFAGVQNALAGGGSFITFPALLLAGLNPLAANMTSTIAMFPSQSTAAYAGRKLVSDVGALSFRKLFIISTIGGVAGALLLLHTPPSIFEKLVPWLVLFATSVFAWGSFRRKPLHAASGMPVWLLVLIQTCIAIYGGYFGGGIGFLMLAALTIAGQQVRAATATKNVLAMAMNAAATLIFATSNLISWPAALALCVGGIAGGMCGGYLIHRLPEKLMRGFVVMVGAVLTVWMFSR